MPSGGATAGAEDADDAAKATSAADASTAEARRIEAPLLRLGVCACSVGIV
jgi:hypothetical protein